MEVVLTHGADHEGQVVRFTSAAAHGWGTWRGGGAAPGGPVDVELEVDAPVTWADALAGGAGPARDPGVGPVGAVLVGAEPVEDAPVGAVLVGTVEEVEPDGVVALRVGPGLVLVELAGSPPPDPRGRAVRLHVPDVGLFPTGV